MDDLLLFPDDFVGSATIEEGIKMTIADGILAKEKPNTVCRRCEDGLRDDKAKECKQEDDTVREMPNRSDVRILSQTHQMRIHLMMTPVQIPIMLEKELESRVLFALHIYRA